MIRLSLVALVVVGAVAAGCGDGGDETSAPAPSRTEPVTVPSGPTTTPPPSRVALPVALTEFGRYANVPAADPDAPRYAGPAQPTSLTGVRVAPDLREPLAAPGVRDALLARGFVVVPSDLRLLHFAYSENEYGGWPVFVTTDAAYHTWHLVFDKVLRDLEQRVLMPKLKTLVSGLMQSSSAQAAAVAGTPLEDDAGRVEQLMQVAAAELGLPVTLGPLAAREKALIDAHSATKVSPILGTKIDYSVFTPRGHYTRNATLRSYFVAMSVLGQSAFCLPGTRDCPGLGPARMAILAARPLNDRADLVALWKQIYEPTAFLVGFSDDYTPLELIQAVRGAVPEALGDPSALAQDGKVESVVAQLVASRPVRINPDHASVRLMGTRFVLDSFILDQLLFPNVGSSEKPRLLPSGLDVPAAFGSEFAYRALRKTGATAYANYDTQLALLRTAVAGRPAGEWGSTVYDAWLYALQPVFARHGTAFPAFMRDDPWAAKDHQTGLGSYAELKHDTILYAKQAVAEGGDGGVPRSGATGSSRSPPRSHAWQPRPSCSEPASRSGSCSVRVRRAPARHHGPARLLRPDRARRAGRRTDRGRGQRPPDGRRRHPRRTLLARFGPRGGRGADDRPGRGHRGRHRERPPRGARGRHRSLRPDLRARRRRLRTLPGRRGRRLLLLRVHQPARRAPRRR